MKTLNRVQEARKILIVGEPEDCLLEEIVDLLGKPTGRKIEIVKEIPDKFKDYSKEKSENGCLIIMEDIHRFEFNPSIK